MSDYLAMCYKHSDYTIVIALVCWPKRINFGAETHLRGGIMSAFVVPLTTIARAPHFHYTAIITIMHWCLRARIHPGGEVVSPVIFWFFFLIAIAHSTRTAWSSRDVH